MCGAAELSAPRREGGPVVTGRPLPKGCKGAACPAFALCQMRLAAGVRGAVPDTFKVASIGG